MKIKIFILLLGYIPLLYSQSTLTGTVTDQNNEPILGVEIYIEQLHIGTTTNENGVFNLGNIANGTHQIVFSSLGFKNRTESILFTNEAKELNIKLDESIFHMDEIIVSTPFRKRQSENTMKVDYKSIKSLEKDGGITLIEGIVSIPGVEQISTGTGIGKPVIRGLSGNRVLVYTQGVRLENQQFGGEHGLGLNESGIESVEVIKGPASLLYGSDALGGVLYFNPEKFALIDETNISLSQKLFSNTMGSNTSLGFKTSKERFKFLARGTYNTHLDYKVPNGDRVTNTRFNEKDFKAGLGYNSDKYVSEFRYNYTDSEIGITEGIENQSSQRTPELPFQEIDNHILSLHNHLFFENSKLDFDLGYVFNHRKEFEEHEEDHDDDHDDDHDEEHIDAALNMKLKTFTYDIKYQFPKIKNFESIIGIQGLSQRNNNFGEEILIPNAKTNDFGILASVLLSLNEESSLQGGIRFDHRNLSTERHEIQHEDEVHIFEALNKSYQNITGSLGYKSLFLKHIITRLNLASGYRAPNLAELTSNGVHHGTNRFEIGNPNLKSEQNFQIDLSLEYQNEHFEVFANGFYNKINDYIFISPTDEIEDGFKVFTYKQNDANLYGGEFGFHFHPHPLDWLHLESSFETVTGRQVNDDYLPLIPANKLANTIRGEFRGNETFNELYVSLNLDSYFSQNNISEFEEKSIGYNLFNLRFGGNISINKSDLRIKLSINNLFNESYISHLSALKLDDIPNPGRNFTLGVNFDFL